jgi:uncharacterized OB-fold protein
LFGFGNVKYRSRSVPQQIPLAPDLFTWPSDAPQLIGSRCAACGVVTFPRQEGCPGCTGADMEDLLLNRRGTLWTWTTQEFPLKSPPYARAETAETFTPFVVGYVELPGEARVEARLTGVEPDDLRIGMELELVVLPYLTRDDGTEVLTYAFTPTGTVTSE